MKLREIFDHLAYGELSALHLCTYDENMELPEDQQKKLISHINAALDDLYTRFDLKKGSFNVNLLPGVTTYTLSRQYAMSNRNARGEQYIDDTAQPLSGEVKKILSVLGDGEELSVNSGVEGEIRTLSLNTLEVPEALGLSVLKVNYRGSAKRISEHDLYAGVDCVEVALPYAHLNALGFFIASRVMAPMNGESALTGNNYVMRYENECIRLSDNGQQMEGDEDRINIRRRGWV
jgi:hypothetical protein